MNGMLNIYHLCHDSQSSDCAMNLCNKFIPARKNILYATDEMQSHIGLKNTHVQKQAIK